MKPAVGNKEDPSVSSTNANPLALIPGVDALLGTTQSAKLIAMYGHNELVSAIRHSLDNIRTEIKEDPTIAIPSTSELLTTVEKKLSMKNESNLKAVLNLTGTVIHTNLGRSQLPQAAIDRIQAVATSASNLEFDISTGKRGDRDNHTEQLLIELTGAEAATVVNNNAAAVLLVLNTLAKDQEVPVSRGELVEIGGSFRIPDIMSGSGCTLIEIGTTNRTHLADYAKAISPDTAMLMKVHTSNYEIQGFTKSVDEASLAALAHDNNIPFVTDLGSGTLTDFASIGLPPEPTVQEAIANGADIVTFSGDKLLGGPQAGIIVGRKDLVNKIKSNPLKRALRVDKMTIAALFEVLKLYRNPDTASTNIPTLNHLTRDPSEIKKTAETLAPALVEVLGLHATVSVLSCESQIGSGSLPTARLASWGIKLIPTSPKANSGQEQILQKLVSAFKALPQPMIGRVQDGSLFFDLRTLDDSRSISNQLVHLKL